MLQSRKGALVAVATTIASSALLPATGALAQTKPGFLHRHSTATGVVAGAATHHALKKSASKSKASGKKLTLAQKHPTVAAVGAGALTKHIAKKTK